jgi:dissimilatory sulfite reductase (desulfoviridin) alpha/beta subunit
MISFRWHRYEDLSNILIHSGTFKCCDHDLNILTKMKISQQPENCENRNDPDLVQAFLKKWRVESDFKGPNLPLSLRFKGSGCHHNSI